MINDHQDGDHWVANPFIPDSQKIRMFDEHLTLMKKIGTLKERKRILAVVKANIAELSDASNDLDASFLPGLKLIEGLIEDDIDKLKE